MKGMLPEDVYNLVSVSDPRVSPDGKTTAYVVTTIDKDENTYRAAIWLVPTDGSAPARQFTRGAKRDMSPRWSPDGTRIAFTSNRDGDSAALYVIPIEGGEAKKLAEFEKESVDDVAWAPTDDRIAFTARVRDEAYEAEKDKDRKPRVITQLKYKLDSVGWTFDRRKHIFVVPADASSEPKQITSGNFDHGAPAWSPDGKQLAFVSARQKDWDIDVGTNGIYLMSSKGGTPKKVTAEVGGYGAPSWSPDGKQLAFDFSPGRWKTVHAQIAVLDLQTKKQKILTSSLDRNCSAFGGRSDPVWTNKDHVLFVTEDHGNNGVYRVKTRGKAEPERLLDGDIRIGGLDTNGGAMVQVRTTPTSLTDLYTGDEQITSHGDAFAKGRKLSAPTRFTAKSADGTEVEAWIMRPVGFKKDKKYPVLLNIHGGPFTQYGNNFFDEFQVYAAAGYVVLYCNPRGSSGYSEAWGQAINGPKLGGHGWGTVDYDDVMAVTDTALKRYKFCDPKRLGVMGGSYGGYLTSWIVAHTDRFKAACSERAVNAWHSMHGSSDYGWPFKAQFGTTVYDDPEGWAEMSPISHATSINTPLLILHSENDLRCPIEQAEQLFTILRLLKKDVEFVRFPAESHELSRGGSPFHRVQRFEIILDWFGRKLKK